MDECKKNLAISSDYKLAKMWELDDSAISLYRAGKLKPDAYLCFRIAETLKKSPSEIIAELESENTKNEVKSLYFKRFFSIVGLWITLAIVWPLYSPSTADAHDNGNVAKSRAVIDLKAHYTKWKRRFRAVVNKLIQDKNVRYFTCNWTRKVLTA